MKRLSAAAALLLLAGCASITKGTDEPISVTTEPAGASCSLRNGVGEWDIDQTPATVTVQRSYSPLVITCITTRNARNSISLEPKTRGRAYGNILLGGVPALYDAHTGAAYDYQPQDVKLTLVPSH